MEKNEFIARLAIEVVTQQIAGGAKHPSPGLITEAVDTAIAVVDELETRFAARQAAQAAAADAKAKADAAATVLVPPAP